MSFFGKKFPNVVELSPSDFDMSGAKPRIKKADKDSMILIYFSYCGYCHQVKPAFLALAKKVGKVYALQGDKDSNRPILEKLAVSSAPDLRFVNSVGMIDSAKYMGERTPEAFEAHIKSKGKKGGARKKKKSASKKKKRVVKRKSASKKKRSVKKGGGRTKVRAPTKSERAYVKARKSAAKRKGVHPSKKTQQQIYRDFDVKYAEAEMKERAGRRVPLLRGGAAPVSLASIKSATAPSMTAAKSKSIMKEIGKKLRKGKKSKKTLFPRRNK